jgi:hypothetical protein
VSNTNLYSQYSHLTIYNKSHKNNAYNRYLSSQSEDVVNNFNLEQNVYSILKQQNQNSSKFFKPHSTININFLRKERLYTKLKYSRSPAYDIVSGGAAAILAGFVGFLISEKFGFELVDSGDFYFLFMYGVFASFSLRPLLTTLNYNNKISTIFSLKPVLMFYVNVINFILKKFK